MLDFLNTVSGYVWGWPLMILLVGTGLWLTFSLRALQFSHLIHAFTLIVRKTPDRKAQGDISNFEALMVALSATVGTGNIAGVATAIYIGGPGALFWMWMTGLVGMATKYAEAVLAVKYRVQNENGTFSGGPMYYISRGLGWKWLATLFAFFAAIATFGIGSMVQSNSVADALNHSFSIAPGITGIVLMGLTAAEAKTMLADPLMILVNHTNKMPENYTFETAECGSKTAVNKTLQTVACNAFLELQKAAAAENVTVWMQSGYRSVSYQTNLYEKKTNYYKQQGYDDAKAKEMAAAIVNPPGYSEHNCGLAADLNSPEHTGLDEGFENTAAFRWLCQHAGEYGFILRYPKGAEEKTEITYEPWHWRYVGVENAAKINASGLCFEDYIAALQQIAG